MNVSGVAEYPDITRCFQILMASARSFIQKIDPIVNSNTPLRSPVLGSRLMP